MSPAQAPGLLARHPILGADGRIVGYELLFAGDAEHSDGAAIEAMAAGDVELAALTGGLPAWIRVSADLLLDFDPLPLAPGTVVVQLRPGTEVDHALLERLARLRSEGHRLALDDFLPGDDTDALVHLAEYVKVDLASYGPAGIRAVLDRLPQRRPVLVATNVETPSQAQTCTRLGATLLQGFFFERPRPLPDRPVPVASLSRLRALMALRGAPSFEDVERVVAGDPGLTVRLMRFANSAAVGAGRRLSTVREALVLLGTHRVRQFVLLVLLSELGRGRPALVSAAVLRGRLAESLARDLRIADPDTAFTAGVLSVVDALLDQPLFDVLKSMPVTEELRWALLGRSGPVGAVLDMAIRLERNRAGEAPARFERIGEAVAWTDQAVGGLL